MRREKYSQVGLYLQEIDNMDKEGNLVIQHLSVFLLAPEEPFSSASPRIVVVELQRGQTMIHSGLPAVQEGKYLLPIARGTGLRLWVFVSTHEHLRHTETFCL